MTRETPVLDALADANPQPTETTPMPSPAELERTLAAITRTPPRRRRQAVRAVRAGTLLPALIVLVVAAVVIVALTGLRGPGRAGSGPHPTVTARTALTLALRPTPAHPRVTPALARAEAAALTARLRQDGVRAHVSVAGTTTVTISAAGVRPSRLLAAVQSPVLAFTDWEANVIASNGRVVAGQLVHPTQAVRLLSQGSERSAPGSSDTGATTLYAAVRRASRQRALPETSSLTRLGAEYFAFAPAGSARCAGSSAPCYVAGPESTRSTLPNGHVLVLRVPQGTIVAQATGGTATAEPDYREPAARFYVLRDNAALTENAVANARVGTDADGVRAVQLRLTTGGQRAFQSLTARVARRANDLGETGNAHQHVAILVDDHLVAVVFIDQNTDPDGVISSGPVSLEGYSGSARQLAAALHVGSLPLGLTPVSR